MGQRPEPTLIIAARALQQNREERRRGQKSGQIKRLVAGGNDGRRIKEQKSARSKIATVYGQGDSRAKEMHRQHRSPVYTCRTIILVLYRKHVNPSHSEPRGLL